MIEMVKRRNLGDTFSSTSTAILSVASQRGMGFMRSSGRLVRSSAV